MSRLITGIASAADPKPAARPMFLALGCVGFLATAPAPAAATSAAAANDTGGDADTGDAADAHADIVVNGVRIASEPVVGKLTVPLIDTPRSIVVVDKDVIKNTGSATLIEALRTVPGITFGAAEGGNPIGDRPFIRGFDSQGSTFVDGVRDIASQSREVFAVEQIQVVRGSDSTLGGRGSAGGTLNIVSKLPRAKTELSGAVSYGTDDYKRTTVDLNYRASDLIALRINAMWHDQDVAGRDALYQKRWGVAPSVTIGIGGPTRLTAIYYHLHSDELPDAGFPYRYVTSASVNNAPAGSVLSEPAVGAFTTASGRTGTISPDTFYGLKDRDFRTTDTDQATLRVEHDLGTFRLRNTARFTAATQDYIYTQPDDSQGDVYGIPAGGQNIGTVPVAAGATQVFNPYTGGGRVWRRANSRFSETRSIVDQADLSGTVRTGALTHTISAGIELAWERAERGAYNVNAGTNATQAGTLFTPGSRCTIAPGTAPYNCTDLFSPNPDDPWVNLVNGVATPLARLGPDTTTVNDGTTKGVYGFDSIAIGDALILNLGARYEDFRSRTLLPVFNGIRPEVSRDDHAFTYQVGAIYKPASNVSVYASYATAATPPNSLLGEGQEANGLGTVSATASQAMVQAASDALKVERTRSYEVGAKADLFDERLSLTAALFQTDTRNARVTNADNTVSFIGRRRIKGLELGFNGQLLPGWKLFGGYTYLDAKIVDGGFTAFVLPAGGGVAARTVLLPSVNTGKAFPQTAKHSFTAWTDLDLSHGLTIGGGAFYMSRVYGGYADNRYVSGTGAAAVVVPATSVIARAVPSYWRFDARAAYRITPAVELAVNVQNLTDKRYFSQAYSSHYATMAPGRSAFATLSFHY